MKKILRLILAVTLIASLLAGYSLQSAAFDADEAELGESRLLTVTCRGQVIGEVEVGNEFIYRVSLNSGGYSVMGLNAQVRYDSSKAELIEYGPVNGSGEVNMNTYSLPSRIRNSNLLTNYFGVENEINYNFSKFYGVGAFTDSDPFFKVRFRALQPGTVEIRHYIYDCYWMNSMKVVKLISNDKGNEQLDPIPYTLCEVEPSSAYIGDADGDYDLTVMDATFIQYLTAGQYSQYKLMNTDVNGDSEINLRDALAILRYKAGMETDADIGNWIFDSEA